MRKFFPSFLYILIFSLLISCSMGSDSSGSGSDTDVLIMMYMDGDNNLNNVSWRNIIQAQNGLMNVSGNAKVTVVALVDGMEKYADLGDGKSYLLKVGAYANSEDQKYLLAKNTVDYSKSVSWVYNGSGIGSHEVDMSSGQTLFYFLNWAKNNFSAQKTILAMQNHGGGPYKELTTSITSQDSARSLCWDETTEASTGVKDTYISTKDISTAISKTFGKIDLLVEDVCLQGSIEEVYGLQDVTNYLIASPNTTYGNTYNYDKIIQYASTGASILDIGKKFVDYNKISCQDKTLRQTSTPNDAPTCMELSLTLVDCSKTESLSKIKQYTSNLAQAILSTSGNEMNTLIASLGKLSKNTATDFYGFCYDATYVYTQDLGVTAYILTSGLSDSVTTAASNLYNELKNSDLIVYGWAGGSENSWYYSADSSYGKAAGLAGDFLRITDGKCPWGLSITSGRNNDKIPLDNYGTWTNFAKNNKWADLISKWKNTAE